MIETKSIIDFFTTTIPGWQQACFVLGVSGGIDSMCLLDCLCKAGIPLIAAHFNHRLRPEADGDAQFVQKMANHYSIPFMYGQVDVIEAASLMHKSIEETARTLRYRFLFETARHNNCEGVIVAHHADDQVETILMHLLRGSGLDGMKGMLPASILDEYDPELPLLRPFLGIWRDEITQYAQVHSISYREDASNRDTQYHRNRIRHELLPILETYNLQVKQRLWQTADILAGDYQSLQGLTKEQHDKVVIHDSDGVVEFSRGKFNELFPGQKRNVLRFMVKTQQPQLRDIGFDSIQSMIAWLNTASENQMERFHTKLCLFNDKEVAVIGDATSIVWWLQQKYPQYTGPCMELLVQGDGSVQLPGGHAFVWDEFTGETKTKLEAIHAASPDEAWIDLDALQQPIILRAFLPGDRMTPIGMTDNHIKLSDMFVNAKTPRLIRKTYPVILSGSQICWLPGLRVADFCKINSNSRKIIHLQWFTPKDQK